VPFGRYPNLNTKIITPEHSRLLQQTQIFRLDYADVFAMADDNDFMFLDPPYDCIFNDYGNIDMMNGFDEEQHRRLANDFRNLNCRALMIIGKTQLTEELYGNLIRDEYFKSYAVNIKNRFKADAKHIVVTNYNPY
jgi:DNA adenine methylase